MDKSDKRLLIGGGHQPFRVLEEPVAFMRVELYKGFAEQVIDNIAWCAQQAITVIFLP